jgi:hypothetical protein
MTGLFLRYCAPCNSPATCAERGEAGLKCKECGGPLKIVDAFALIPALGELAGKDKRCIAVAELAGHDLPKD